MFHTRTNQENLTHLHQTTAASKPLNQAKTPGPKAPKTPFRNARDENNITFAQTGLEPKVKHDVFVTPAGTAARAPLGIKTTNFKTRQTPGLQPHRSAKQTSPRLRRSKVKIHQALQQPESEFAEQDEPDIEYMPPRSVPLPDYPDDSDDERMQADAERIYQELCKENIPPEDDIDTIFQVDEATKRSQDAAIARSLAQTFTLQPDTDDSTERTSKMKKTTTRRSQQPVDFQSLQPRPLASKSAPSKHTDTSTSSPSFAKPTASALARVSGPERLTDSSLNNAKRGAGIASRQQTLGYAKGRAVSANARRFQGASNAHLAPVFKKRHEAERDEGLIAGFKRAGLGSDDRVSEDATSTGRKGLDLEGLDPDVVFGDFELERVSEDET